MKRKYQAPIVFVDQMTYFESFLAGTEQRQIGGGPKNDDVKPFPSSVFLSEDGNDGMTSGNGQGSFGAGNRSNESTLWDE